jgi:hypothetical protein
MKPVGTAAPGCPWSEAPRVKIELVKIKLVKIEAVKVEVQSGHSLRLCSRRLCPLLLTSTYRSQRRTYPTPAAERRHMLAPDVSPG